LYSLLEYSSVLARLQVLIQHAMAAGKQAATVRMLQTGILEPSIAEGLQLLERAFSMAAQYHVPVWQLQAAFLASAFACATDISTAVRL
jgi:hypothetical protein